MHKAVLLTEVLEYLDPKPGQVIVDGTVGSGGHAEAILERLGRDGVLIGIDRDPAAIERSCERLASKYPNARFIHANYASFDSILDPLGIRQVDAFFLDLGLSSEQLNDSARGFSFQTTGFLDMRMDPTDPLTAFEVVNRYPEARIAEILRTFGQESRARAIARKIVEKRRQQVLQTTQDIADIVDAVYQRRRGKIHPATRMFQALRIEVNRELDDLEKSVPKIVARLRIGGKIGVISFHSLEDRIVKLAFRQLAQQGVLEVITRKPIRPTRKEVLENRRARSARFRVAVKVA